MDNNRGFSAIGTARSALASIVTLKCGTPVGSHPLVKKFTQGVFNLKPPTPRYVDIWDPETVLKFLKSWSPAKSLGLTKLVKKLCVLILLVTGQRGQILQALTIDNMSVGKNAYTFKIENKDVKQGWRGYMPEPLILRTFPADKRLCVYHYMTVYLKRTVDIRVKNRSILLIGVKPYNPPSRDTFSRWVKQVLNLSGVDTNKFGAGSTRAAATSKAIASGSNLDEVLKSAGWVKKSTFQKWYSKPICKKSESLSKFVLKWVWIDLFIVSLFCQFYHGAFKISWELCGGHWAEIRL